MRARLVASALVAGVLLAFVPGAAQAASVVATVAVGSTPWGVVVSADGMRAYVSNSASNSVSVIDTSTSAVIATVAVGNTPKAIAITPSGAKVFVANSVAGTYSVIDTATNTVVQAIPAITNCANPASLAMHPAGGTVYVGCGSAARIFGIDTTTYATTQISNGTYAIDALAVSPDASQLTGVGSSYGGAADWVNSAWTPQIGHGPNALASRQDGSVFYVANSDGSMTSMALTGATIANWSVGTSLNAVAITHDDVTAYVTDGSAGTLVAVDLATQVSRTVATVGSAPRGLALSPDETRAYVVNSTSDTVSVVSLRDAVPDEPEQRPASVLQQYAVGADETCGANAPASTDLPALDGLRAEGWSRSWARWPNDGAGGTVCTRIVSYAGAGRWAVG